MYLFQNGGLVTEKQTLASICVQCGKCIEKCPQHLAIPELLKEVAEDLEGFMTKPLIWLGRRKLKVKGKETNQSGAGSQASNCRK